MAAVAILGIVYAYLAQAASQGILTVGDSRWRLEASLLADEAMAQLQQQMQAGAPLPVGPEEETEAGEFIVSRKVGYFNLPEETFPLPEAGPSLLHPGGTNFGILRVVIIRVKWFDGIEDRVLRRITFAYDAGRAGELLGTSGLLDAATLGDPSQLPSPPPGDGS